MRRAPGPEGFVFKVIGVPKSLQDLDVIQYVLRAAMLYDPEHPLTGPEGEEHQIETTVSQCFELPYEQGYGFCTLVKKLAYEYRWGEDEPSDSDHPEHYTGWEAMFGYSDSMTGLFVTPIFYDPATKQFYFWEM